MNLLAVGVTFQTAGVALRERIAFTDAQRDADTARDRMESLENELVELEAQVDNFRQRVMSTLED